jgi:hypothetical protein
VLTTTRGREIYSHLRGAAAAARPRRGGRGSPRGR